MDDIMWGQVNIKFYSDYTILYIYYTINFNYKLNVAGVSICLHLVDTLSTAVHH